MCEEWEKKPCRITRGSSLYIYIYTSLMMGNTLSVSLPWPSDSNLLISMKGGMTLKGLCLSGHVIQPKMPHTNESSFEFMFYTSFLLNSIYILFSSTISATYTSSMILYRSLGKRPQKNKRAIILKSLAGDILYGTCTVI